MSEHDNNQWQDLLNGLPRAIQPQHDLWAGIEAQLLNEQQARTHSRRSYAAAAVILIAAGALSLFLALPQRGPVQPKAGRVATIKHSFGSELRHVHRLPNAVGMKPTTHATLARNLEIVRTAMADIRRALREDPGNSSLHDLLYQVHEDQNALLVTNERIKLQTNLRKRL